VTGAGLALGLLAVAGLAACGGTPSDRALAAADALPGTTTTTTATPGSSTTGCDASLRPLAEQPQPGQMPPGVLRAIQEREVLRVGVDQNTLGFGWRDRNGELRGFDVALAEEIGLAIFGERGHVQFVAVTSRERIPAIVERQVDLVVSVMSITCERRQDVAFSTEYFRAHQRVLVPRDSDILTVEDLNGRTVCATATSTSLDNLEVFAPEAEPYAVDARTDCLVALQQGRVDSASTDDTILFGFMFQDPKLRLLPDTFHEEQYGIAVHPDDTDLVRFVNGVLEDLRAGGPDSRWVELFAEETVALFEDRLESAFNLARALPPEPVYEDEP
jgi:polar amino acid transport system substrate-binding protein